MDYGRQPIAIGHLSDLVLKHGLVIGFWSALLLTSTWLSFSLIFSPFQQKKPRSLWRNNNSIKPYISSCADNLIKPVVNFYAPLEKGNILFCNCRSVGISVCRPSVVRSISFDSFTWSIPNLVQGLPSMSRCSILIFRSHDQRSRSNHSSQPTVLSAQYFLPLHLINTKLGTGVVLIE